MSLTPAQTERLVLLAEECAEVVQRVTKILRFGYDNNHPRTGVVNRRALHEELGDLGCIIEMMVEAGDIDMDTLSACTEEKAKKIHKHLRHQGAG